MTRRKLLPFRISFSCLLSLLLLVSLLPRARAHESQSATDLKPGSPIERQIKGGESHIYTIALNSNQYLRVSLEQRGVNLSLSLLSSDGRRIAQADAPHVTYGIETILFVADSAGIYKLDVRSTRRTATALSYQIRVEEMRPSTAEDQDRISAFRAFEEAERFLKQTDTESQNKALERYETAARLYQKTGETFLQAISMKGAAYTLEFLQETEKAYETYLKVLPLLQNSSYRQEPALTLVDMARTRRRVFKHRAALEYYNQALQLFRATANRKREADALLDMAGIYLELGDMQKAIDHSHESALIAHLEGDAEREARSLLYLGRVYASLSDPASALYYLTQSLPLFEGRGAFDEPGALYHVGRAYAEMGEREKAFEYFDKALAIMRRFRDVDGEAIVLIYIGRMRFLGGEVEKALELFIQASKIFHENDLPVSEAITLNQMGKCYEAMGDADKALDYFKQSLRIVQPTEDRVREALTRYSISSIERARGNTKEALTQIETAIDLIESRRARIDAEALRASFLASFQSLYELYIALLMESGNGSEQSIAAALETSERARARSLLDLLIQARIPVTQGLDPELAGRERELTQKLNERARTLTQILSRQHTEEEARAARREVEGASIELQEIRARISQSSPKYSALTQPQTLKLAEIQQQLLDKDSLLLEYSLGEKRSYLWAVTSTTIKSYALPPRAEIEAAARKVYELVTARNLTVEFETQDERRERIRKADADQKEAAAHLSKMILDPVAQELNRKILIIVPDGALQYIPFAALPAPVTRGRGDAETRRHEAGRVVAVSPRPPLAASRTPLIADHEIVSIPSASTLAVIRRETKGRKPAPKMIAVLADPVFESSDERLTSAREMKKPAGQFVSQSRRGESVSDLKRAASDVALSEREIKLQRLPFTRREAERIASLFRREEVKKALDFDASRTTALSNEMKEYRYVHFATHGFLNTRHPELSGLALSMFDKEGAEQDGFLRANEVYNLSLPAELVVLSGCRTGLGKEIRGEGLISLTRAFMYAGAARVMVSLWDVNDEATAEFMSRFYTAIVKQKMTPAAALRFAQAQMSKDPRWNHPYYWAGFILQGEPY